MLAGKLTKEEAEGILNGLSTLACESGLDVEPTTENSDLPLVLCRSFDTSADAIALRWLRHSLESEQIRWDSIAPSALVSEVIEQVETLQPSMVCICEMPPGISSSAQLLCKRLRHRFPELKILLARWGSQKTVTTAESGATWVVTTTEQAHERLSEALHLGQEAI